MTSRNQANPRILMMGCGAVGGVLAAGLLGAGYDVTIVTRNPAISSAVASNGLHLVTPAGRRTLPAAICADTCPDLAATQGAFDVVLLSMKATDVLEAARRGGASARRTWLCRDASERYRGGQRCRGHR